MEKGQRERPAAKKPIKPSSDNVFRRASMGKQQDARSSALDCNKGKGGSLDKILNGLFPKGKRTLTVNSVPGGVAKALLDLEKTDNKRKRWTDNDKGSGSKTLESQSTEDQAVLLRQILQELKKISTTVDTIRDKMN